MESFANLFRKSKLNTLDSGLKQILSAPAKQRTQGNWGLKHWMPGHIKSRCINLYNKDGIDKEDWVSWKSADQVFLRREAFIENFLPFLASEHLSALSSQKNSLKSISGLFQNSDNLIGDKESKPEAKSMSNILGKRSIAKMNSSDFASYIDALKSRIQKKYPNYVMTGTETSVHPPYYFYHSGSSKKVPSNNIEHPLMCKLKDAERNCNLKSSAIQVTGRILGRHSFREARTNRIVSGYTVGIAGFVAYLPENKFVYTPGMAGGAQGRRGPLKQFFIDYISFDSQGRPQIELSLLKQESGGGSGLLSVNRSSSSGFSLFGPAANRGDPSKQGATKRYVPSSVSSMPLNRPGLFGKPSTSTHGRGMIPTSTSNSPKHLSPVYKSFLERKQREAGADKNDDKPTSNSKKK